MKLYRPLDPDPGRSRGFNLGINHLGIDYNCWTGTPIYATASGAVTRIADEPTGYGNLVCVDHDDGWSTRYAHLSRIDVVLGQWVDAGQVIGLSGGTRGAAGAGNSQGPHLHYELRKHNEAVDPDHHFSDGRPHEQEDDMPKGFFVHAPNSPFVWFIRPDGTRIATTDERHIDLMAYVGFASNDRNTIHEWDQADIDRFPQAE